MATRLLLLSPANGPLGDALAQHLLSQGIDVFHGTGLLEAFDLLTAHVFSLIVVIEPLGCEVLPPGRELVAVALQVTPILRVNAQGNSLFKSFMNSIGDQTVAASVSRDSLVELITETASVSSQILKEGQLSKTPLSLVLEWACRAQFCGILTLNTQGEPLHIQVKDGHYSAPSTDSSQLLQALSPKAQGSFTLQALPKEAVRFDDVVFEVPADAPPGPAQKPTRRSVWFGSIVFLSLVGASALAYVYTLRSRQKDASPVHVISPFVTPQAAVAPPSLSAPVLVQPSAPQMTSTPSPPNPASTHTPPPSKSERVKVTPKKQDTSEVFETLLRKGQQDIEAGELDRAKGHLEQALKIRRKDPQVHLALGTIYLMQSQNALAQSHFQSYLSYEKPSAKNREQRAEIERILKGLP